MPNYVLSYHGDGGEMPSDPAAIEAAMAEWGAWYGTMGDALVDGGAPFSTHTAINADGSTDAPAQLTGYTIVKTADAAAAAEIAKGCPVVANGLTVQISECIDMG